MNGGSQQRPKLSLEYFSMAEAIANGSQTHDRVILGHIIAKGFDLAAAEVDGPHNGRAGVDSLCQGSVYCSEPLPHSNPTSTPQPPPSYNAMIPFTLHSGSVPRASVNGQVHGGEVPVEDLWADSAGDAGVPPAGGRGDHAPRPQVEGVLAHPIWRGRGVGLWF